MFLPNPGILAAGAQGRTYDEFVARINALAGGLSSPWNGDTVAGSRVLVAGTVGEFATMSGSPWGPLSPNGVRNVGHAACRVIQHSLSSYETFLDQIANGRKILLNRTTTGFTDFLPVSVSRNNYTSYVASSGTHWTVTEVIYWDGSRAQRMQPFLGVGPEPYDW